MRAKDYLKNIELLNARIEMKEKELDDLKRSIGLIKSTSYEKERVQESQGAFDKVGDLVVKIEDQMNEVNTAIDAYVDAKREASDLMSKMENPDYIKLLNFRYFDFKSFEEIAVIMGFSYRHTTRLHGFALQDFQKILDEKKRA